VILLDSSVLIAVERGHLDLKRFFKQFENESFAVSAVTASEILHGLHRSDIARRVTREAFVEAILQDIPILPFDLVAARIHARLWADLMSKGVTIGPHDLLIAATALTAGARIATRDERSFRRIPGLTLLIP
jgi:predicted nucleic acid-binding protein